MGELQKRFTAWLKKLVQNARIDYLRRTNRKLIEIPFTQLSEGDRIKLVEKSMTSIVIEEDAFQNIDVEIIFYALPEGQKNILSLLFVSGLTTQEISACIGCSKQYIYNQKYLALKKMKEGMMKNKDGGQFSGKFEEGN